jgi:hypothetical protein
MSMTFNKGILLGVVSIFIVACSPMEKDNGTITVNNKTDSPVYNVNFKYKTSKRVDVIGDLAPNASYKYQIQLCTRQKKITH